MIIYFFSPSKTPARRTTRTVAARPRLSAVFSGKNLSRDTPPLKVLIV
jgi:hypothetical protein